YRFLSAFRQLSQVSIIGVPAVRVSLQFASYAAPNGVVNCLPRALSDNIPQCRFDACHCGKHDGPGVMLNLVELEPDRLDIKWIVTNDVTPSQVENQVPDRALLPFQCAITPANDPLIRCQFYKQEVSPNPCG